MKHIKRRWFVFLGLLVLTGFIGQRSHGMEPTPEEQEKKQFFAYLKSLPAEVQQKIQNLMAQDALIFLASEPITLQHPHVVSSVAISGNILVIGSEDTAQIWDMRTNQLLHTLEGHASRITSVAISGNTIVTGSADNTAKIWDINGNLLHTLQGHTNDVSSVAISGDIVATGSWDDTVKIWNKTTGELLRTIEENGGIIALATNETMIITLSAESFALGKNYKFISKVNMWNISDGELVYTLEASGIVSSLAISGNTIVTGTNSNLTHLAMIWNTDGQLLHTLEGHFGQINSVAISGDIVATGSWDGTAKIWNKNTGQLLGTLIGFGAIQSIAINADSVAVGEAVTQLPSVKGVVEIWSLAPYEGTPDANPLLWIIYNANILQIDLIKRTYEANEYEEKSLELESKDLQVFMSFPQPVRRYLLDRLKIHIKKVKPPKFKAAKAA